MRRRWAIAAPMIACLIAITAIPSSTTAITPDPSDGAPTDSISPTQERALDFRKLFGLDADPSLIERAEADPTYSSSTYGVPLSRDEEAELQRRVQLEWDSHAAVDFAAKQPTWGGYYIDQLARGAPVFLFTADTDTMRVALQSLLPSDSGFRVEGVEHTKAELVDLKERIYAAWGDLRSRGIHVTHTGIDVSGNSVTVGIDGLTDAAILEIKQRFGSTITFKDRPAAVADTCPTSGCRPIKGGIKILGANGLPCTSGWIVRRGAHGNALAVLTAGHCIKLNGPIQAPWTHSADRFGDSKYHAWFENSVGDVGLVEIDDDEQPASANKVFIDPTGSSGMIYTVTNYVLNLYQTDGVQACAYGYKSDNSACVTITDTDVNNESCNPSETICYNIRHTNEYGWSLIGGDSGGPVYQTSGTNRLALGTHVHSDDAAGPGTGWYTTVEWGLSAYIGASGGEGFVLCITAAC